MGGRGGPAATADEGALTGAHTPQTDAGSDANSLQHRGPSGARYIENVDPATIKAYEQIAASTDDVPSIAQKYGLPEECVTRVKEHLFLTEHEVPVGPNQVVKGRFTPDSDIADLWMKASNGSLSPDERAHFNRLIAHEYIEGGLMSEGMPYRSSDPEAYEMDTDGTWLNRATPEHYGAHDVAPLTDPARDPFAHWQRILGRSPEGLMLKQDLSNLGELLESIKGRIR